MDVDALTLPHMAHGEADCTAKVLERARRSVFAGQDHRIAHGRSARHRMGGGSRLGGWCKLRTV